MPYLKTYSIKSVVFNPVSKKLTLVLFLICLGWFQAFSQKSPPIELSNLLVQLASMQSTGNLNYPKGAFTSQRKYNYSSNYKEDYNLFFTALVLFNLERYKSYLSKQDQEYADTIRKNALPYFKLFLNKKNNTTYNFWQKDPPVIFPNGGWLNRYNQSKALPDDIDDCAIAMMALGGSINGVDSMKNYFVAYRNSEKKIAKSFYSKYSNRQVYSTWLGAKFPIDIDICVLSNVLVMNYQYGGRFNQTDSASLQLIIDLVKAEKYIRDPQYVSQHYENTSTILYHLARLMSYSNDVSLLALKPILVKQTYKALHTSKNGLEQLILKNALLQYGETGPDLVFTDRDSLHNNNYPFFIANMSAVLNNPFKRMVAFSKIGRFEYYSEAYNLSLLIENSVLSQIGHKY